MQIKNSKNRFGLIAILFHWVMAILVIGILCLGLYMTALPAGDERSNLYGWHKAFGILIFMLVVPRLLWRVSNITPQLAIPLLEKMIARTVHWALYGFMVAMPVTGWLMSSAAGYPPSFFGLFVLPGLLAPNPDLVPLLGNLHKWIAYGLIATLVLHTLAALKHHFIDKNTILRRMFY